MCGKGICCAQGLLHVDPKNLHVLTFPSSARTPTFSSTIISSLHHQVRNAAWETPRVGCPSPRRGTSARVSSSPYSRPSHKTSSTSSDGSTLSEHKPFAFQSPLSRILRLSFGGPSKTPPHLSYQRPPSLLVPNLLTGGQVCARKIRIMNRVRFPRLNACMVRLFAPGFSSQSSGTRLRVLLHSRFPSISSVTTVVGMLLPCCRTKPHPTARSWQTCTTRPPFSYHVQPNGPLLRKAGDGTKYQSNP